MTDFEEKIDYGINYVRNAVIGLSMKHKPVIVSGIYLYNNDLSYSTFLDIKPYKQGTSVVTKTLCNHISIWNEYVTPYFNFKPQYDKHRFYLICEAYTYVTDGVRRGGLRPTEELKINPIIPYEDEKILHEIPQDKYIDFFKFADGKYAWIFGHPNFIGSKLIKKERKHLKVHKPETKEEPEIVLNKLSNGVIIPDYPFHINKNSTKYKKAFQTLSSDWMGF